MNLFDRANSDFARYQSVVKSKFVRYERRKIIRICFCPLGHHAVIYIVLLHEPKKDADVPANTKYLHNICTTSIQRLRRWTDIIQMLCKYFVFAGTSASFCITSVQLRPNVFDVGPTFYKCYTNFLCLLHVIFPMY